MAHQKVDLKDKELLPVLTDQMLLAEKKLLLKEHLAETWQNEWLNSIKGRSTFRFVPLVPLGRNPSIHLTSEITQMLTNHGNFNSYLCRFGKRNSGLCEE